MEALFNEKDLLGQLAAGDENALGPLFDHYADSIYGVAFSYTKSEVTSEELVLDIFLK